MHDNSYAAFAQTDWTFAPTWKLTTGLRYTYDILKGGEQFRELCFGLPACLGNVFGNIPTPYILGAFTPVNDITASDPAIANCFNGIGCKYPGVRGTPYLLPNGSWARDLGANWHAPTGTLGLEWTPDANTLAYLKYSRGYKSGGFNASTISVNPESQAEHLDAIELGGKEVFNRILQVNGALFYYNYKDKQIPLTLEGFNGGPNISSIVNIPKVQSYGAEFETIWQPWTDMQFLFDYSYLSATIKGESGACGTTTPVSSCYQNVISGAFENTNGNTVPESPRSKIALERQLHVALHAGFVELLGQLCLEGQDARQHFQRRVLHCAFLFAGRYAPDLERCRRSLHGFRLHQEPAKQAGL